MAVLNTRPAPVQRSRRDVIAGDIQIPMSQQSTLGSHGHDMHPQGFVRLSGCQEQREDKAEPAPTPH
jgi:hypothetical protein